MKKYIELFWWKLVSTMYFFRFNYVLDPENSKKIQFFIQVHGNVTND